MDQLHIELISKLQSYIEAHIKEKMTLKALSKLIGYSPWYADKLFKMYTNKSLMQYIKERRLTLAALDLRDHNKYVMDIALDFLFDSHEGFTRAFPSILV